MSNDSPILHPITHDRFLADVQALARAVEAGDWAPDMLVGVGRGGLVPAVYLSHRLNCPMLSIDYSSASADAALADVAARSAAGTQLLIVDDINDSGGTISALRGLLADKGGDMAHLRFAVLLNNRRSGQSVDYWADSVDRDTDKRWFVFPWEELATQQAIVDEALSVPDRLA
ncbi:phosphoribosyltransferase family protein [Sphingobium sp. WCS2017Hpa-17]|uniref:phosphoribosyltransferase n=1 Tax=Sphingobium sp. WCS2017Hpa-17 TaxID=3073638 RepID=UPI00288B4469|nr:phosphoribosyltransferase family protein [Sphingobium sp. WCS2017Hpa-17]